MNEQNNPSIFLSLFAYGDIKAETLPCYLDTIGLIMRDKIRLKLQIIREDALIDRSRSRACASFLLSGADVWIQMDHDLVFDPRDLFSLAEHCHATQACVCVPYSKRALPAEPALRTLPDHPLFMGKDVLVPIVASATGMCSTPRAALIQALTILEDSSTPTPYRVEWCDDVMVKKFPSLFQPFVFSHSDGRKEYLSEDYAASLRLKLAGIPQFAWTKPILGHVSNFQYKLNASEEPHVTGMPSQSKALTGTTEPESKAS